MSGYELGIDYGSTNTVAVLRWPDGRCRPMFFDGSPLLPSAVFLQPDGELIPGRDALHSARLDPTRFEPNPKRCIDDGALLLGDRQVAMVDVVAATLRRVAEEATRACGTHPATVALTYPAGWGAARRSVLVEAAVSADLPTPTLVSEPVAAAGYFTTVLGHAVRPGHLLVVYDLGGGTLDLAVVRRTGDGFEVREVDGLTDFGGLDLDALVVARVAAAIQPADSAAWQRVTAPADPTGQRHFRTLWDDARTAKEMLSRQSNARLYVPLVDREVSVGREEFEEAARPYLDRAAMLTAQVMRRAGVSAENLAGIFLVGGASRVPLVATTLHRATGLAPTVLEQPEIVVAEGALHAIHRPPSVAAPPAVVPPMRAAMSPAPVVTGPAPGPSLAAPTAPPPGSPPSSPPAPVMPPVPSMSPAPVIPSLPPPGAVWTAGPKWSGSLPRPVWAVFAVLILLVPLMCSFLNSLLGAMALLGCTVASAFLFRRAVAWRPGPAAFGLARPRRGAGAVGTILTALGGAMLPVALFLVAITVISDDARDNQLIAALVIAGVGLMVALGGLALLWRALCPYPRLVVSAYGITYQPDRRDRYELPWASLARVDVAPPGPGLPPALVAVPATASQVAHDPSFAQLWRADINALVIAELPRLTRDVGGDAPRLVAALAHHRTTATGYSAWLNRP